MKPVNFLLFVLFLVSSLMLSPSTAQAIQQQQPLVELSDLDPDTDWSALFEAETGAPADGTHFGAYVFNSIGDELYIGFGSARPAEQDGALIAAFDGEQSRSVGYLDEQGINEIITSDSGSLIIGGVDPSFGDGWDLGNAYTSDGFTTQKHRDQAGLFNVFHMWGLEQARNGRIYATTSSHDGSFPANCLYGISCFGEIFESTDGGHSWSQISRLGGYRAYDIQEFRGSLYALYTDIWKGDVRLGVSQDDGLSWQQLMLPTADGRRTHLVAMKNKLVMLGGGDQGDRIYSIGPPNKSVQEHVLPFSVGLLDADAPHFSHYNQFVFAKGLLYAITRDGQVMRSKDLQNWELVADTNRELISIGYWPAADRILLGERGPGARIWTLEPCKRNGRC